MKIKCEICENEYNAITSTHLKIHSITVEEYKRLYPNSPIVNVCVSKKLSENAKNNSLIGFKKGVKHKKKSPWNKGLKKESDERVMRYSEKNKKPKSEEHKLKLSISKTKNLKYDFCENCKISKSKTVRKFCVSCAQKKRSEKYVNPMKGKKLSEEHKFKLLKSQKRSFTKPEMKVYESYLDSIEYTGDRSKWVKFKDGTVKNPDFIIKNQRVVIEVFGDYWHKGEDPNILIRNYNEIGYDCLVLWESDIKSRTHESIKELIDSFINQLKKI